MTDEELRVRLRAECEKAGSVRAWADAKAFTQGFVSDVINGRKRPTARLAAALGLARKVEYVPSQSPE